VDECLAAYLKNASACALNAEMAAYHLSTGGKRLRALIPGMVFESLGQDPARAVVIGAAVELIHNGTLVHDDLQDGDDTRRGMPTVWKKYSPAQAINCGDAMLYLALQLLLESDFPDRVRRRLTASAVSATLEVIEGQAKEFRMKAEAFPGVERYIEMVRGKTSALISMPVRLAMEALEIPVEACKTVCAAAADLGVLFQIQDDVLDLYGDKNRGRKAPDIAEGKISLLVAHVFSTASEGDREALNAILRKPREQTTDDDIERALGILAKYDAKGFAIKKIRSIQQALAEDAGLRSQSEIRALLIGLGEVFLKPIQKVMRGA